MSNGFLLNRVHYISGICFCDSEHRHISIVNIIGESIQAWLILIPLWAQLQAKTLEKDWKPHPLILNYIPQNLFYLECRNNFNVRYLSEVGYVLSLLNKLHLLERCISILLNTLVGSFKGLTGILLKKLCRTLRFMDPNPEICRWKLTIQYGTELNIVPWPSFLINRIYGMTYLTRGWDKGGCGWWSRWGRACRCHSRLLRPYLLQLFWTANGILMTPADLQPREAQGLALHCGRLRGVKSSGDTEAARADRTQARQQLSKVCVRAKSLLSVYFGAHACYCAINNGWGWWWECSTGNRKRHPCHPLKSRNSEYSGEGKGWGGITFLSLKSAAVHLHSAATKIIYITIWQ